MGFWPWGNTKEDAKVAEALAAEKAAHSDLVNVVTELESVVARLSGLPEVQAARSKNRRTRRDD